MIPQSLSALKLPHSIFSERDKHLQNPHVRNHNVAQHSTVAAATDQQNQAENMAQSVQGDDKYVQISPEARANYSNLQVQDLSTSVHQSFDIQIKTQEGDTVTIRFDGMNATHQSAFEANNKDGSVSGYQSESVSSSDFQMTIDGNLNEDEQKSLQDLMKQIKNVGQDFFKGDVKSAFKQAANIGFSTDQIAGFSLNMNMEKTVRAVSAYQSVSEQQPVDANALKKVVDFSQQAAQKLAGPTEAVKVFADPSSAFKDLVENITKSVASQFEGMSDLAQHVANLTKLLGQFNPFDALAPGVSDVTSQPKVEQATVPTAEVEKA